jgi:penicillin-binding protein 2
VDRFPLSENTVEKVTDGMYGVVNEAGGTASHLKLENVEFSGKSGTAQIIGYDLRDRLGKQKQFKDNAWFVGYAPKRNPEIVVAVLVQAGGHGAEAAAPVARDIIKAYYDKKNGKVPTPQILTNDGQAPAPPVVKPTSQAVKPVPAAVEHN